MRILLFSCPDATHPLFPRFAKPPHLGLCMLSAMVKDLARVKIADLVLRNKDVPAAVREAMSRVLPDLVGISAMTFQFDTAKKIAALVREVSPGVKIVLGGYHASLNYRAVARDPGAGFDFIIRGEGEHPFRQLVKALSGKGDLDRIPGLSFRCQGQVVHNPGADPAPLETLPLPDRGSRLWQGYHVVGTPFDIVETSRGCTMPCTFCCITRHYGRGFRAFDLSRVIRDIRLVREQGAHTVFLADDNITLDPGRFGSLCQALVREGLSDLKFSTQASVSGLFGREDLIEKMALANFKLVFLGIENIAGRNLSFFKKGDIAEKTEWVLRLMRKHRILVMGGFILGSPQDTAQDIKQQFDFIRERAMDCMLVQILTPYPGTPLAEEMERQGYIVNRDLRRYNGFFANVRTDTLSSRDLEFLKWKHMPYYRNRRWFRESEYSRQAPLKFILREAAIRAGQLLMEKARILLKGEAYAFFRHCQSHLNANSFFGENQVPVWPDDDGKHIRDI